MLVRTKKSEYCSLSPKAKVQISVINTIVRSKTTHSQLTNKQMVDDGKSRGQENRRKTAIQSQITTFRNPDDNAGNKLQNAVQCSKSETPPGDAKRSATTAIHNDESMIGMVCQVEEVISISDTK